jgi:hypothetical protein
LAATDYVFHASPAAGRRRDRYNMLLRRSLCTFYTCGSLLRLCQHVLSLLVNRSGKQLLRVT